MKIKADVPTIGCAKETLIRYRGDVGERKRSHLPIKDGDEVVGAALKTQDRVKPVFVSPGHRVSLSTAIEVILHLSRYRIPEPLRRADQSARACASGIPPEGVILLGELGQEITEK